MLSDEEVSDALRQELKKYNITNEMEDGPLELPPNNDDIDEYDQSNAWKRELFARLNRIRLLCGELCTLNTLDAIDEHSRPNPLVPELPTITIPKENIHCPTLLGMEHVDAGDITFPKVVPGPLQKYYTLNGQFTFRFDAKIRKDAYLGGESEKSLFATGSTWTKEGIEETIQKIKLGTEKGSYGIDETNHLKEALIEGDPHRLNDTSILVIGSSHP